ncbi:putative disease resistance protein RGA4 [Bienertia sinuspersici]
MFDESCVESEAVLEKLQNIKGLSLKYHNGTNNTKISIANCGKLVNLPSFSKLPFLKSLELENLHNMEHLEKISSSFTGSTFFPSFESLIIYGLAKFKGWWFLGREVGGC